jgi:hypothetical protein
MKTKPVHRLKYTPAQAWISQNGRRQRLHICSDCITLRGRGYPLAATTASPTVTDLTSGLLARPLQLRPPRLLSLADPLSGRSGHLASTPLSFSPASIPNQPAAFPSLLFPRKQALAAASSEPPLRCPKLRECLEDSPGFLRDLKEALFCADDGVGAEVRDSLLSLCHSWRVSHNLVPMRHAQYLLPTPSRGHSRAIRWTDVVCATGLLKRPQLLTACRPLMALRHNLARRRFSSGIRLIA